MSLCSENSLAASLLGTLLAGECGVRLYSACRILCAKLHRHNDKHCIFLCSYTS